MARQGKFWEEERHRCSHLLDHRKQNENALLREGIKPHGLRSSEGGLAGGCKQYNVHAGSQILLPWTSSEPSPGKPAPQCPVCFYKALMWLLF